MFFVDILYSYGIIILGRKGTEMKNYKICLPKQTFVGKKLISFDHWVTVKANSELEAKSKAVHKIARQMLYGDKCEPCFVLTNTPLRSIKADIDMGDFEVYESDG